MKAYISVGAFTATAAEAMYCRLKLQMVSISTAMSTTAEAARMGAVIRRRSASHRRAPVNTP